MPKVPPRKAASKVAKLEKELVGRRRPPTPEARDWIARNAAALDGLPAAEPKGGSLSPEAARARKQQNDRDRKGFRRRYRPPRGFVETNDGSVEAKDAPKFAMRMPTDGRAPLIDAGPGFWKEVEPVDRWMLGRMTSFLEDASGDTIGVGANGQFERSPGHRAPSYALERLRRAYVAATGWPPEHEWQRHLRLLTEHVLHFRLGKPGKPGAKPPMTAADVVTAIRFQSLPGSVPAGLTGARVELLLKGATLARGGHKANFNRAIDALISELGAVPHKPT